METGKLDIVWMAISFFVPFYAVWKTHGICLELYMTILLTLCGYFPGCFFACYLYYKSVESGNAVAHSSKV